MFFDENCHSYLLGGRTFYRARLIIIHGYIKSYIVPWKNFLVHYSALKIEEKILNFIPTVTNFMNINIDAQRGGGGSDWY